MRRTGSSIAANRTSAVVTANCIRALRGRWRWNSERVSRTRGEGFATIVPELMFRVGRRKRRRRSARAGTLAARGSSFVTVRKVFQLDRYLKERAAVVERALAQVIPEPAGSEARLHEAM